MRKSFFRILITVLLIPFSLHIIFSQESIVLSSAKKEMDRVMEKFNKEQYPPYFLSYEISEINGISITASFGKIETNVTNKSRILDIDVRVGDYKFDNTHIIRGASFSFGSDRTVTELPIEDNEEAIRNAIWFATDKQYKKAVETYQKALTNKAVKVQEEDTSADFSYEKPHKYTDSKVVFKIDKKSWEERLRKLSALFANEDWLYNGSVSLNVDVQTKYYLNSDGEEIEQSNSHARVFLSASTKATDGMNLPLYKSYFAFDADSLPDENTMKQDLFKMVLTLKALREAPLMTTFTGPAILSGEAAGVFFHEIFGHRVEGHRLKDPNNSQTFKGSINTKILPDFMNVVFDPTINYLKGHAVSGGFKFDDEGVEGQKVICVDNGIFKNFLMDRSPIEGFSHSNGHGRKQAGFKATSRQSNLIVSSNIIIPINELKNKLREECKKQGKEFGLFFEKVQGGFTFTGRSIPNSFNVNPLIVYKIYADGKADELVRGVDLIGTPLTTFANIIAAGDDLGVFNGICGAESGNVPVSACSPSLLVSTIEVQKKAKSQAKPPILAAPSDNHAE
ncbi:MAG: TldD/PmbA family protein [FCB group bacterium]